MLNYLLYLIGIVCAVWVIFEVWTQAKRMKTVEKVVWTVCALFFSIITAAVYYFLKKR